MSHANIRWKRLKNMNYLYSECHGTKGKKETEYKFEQSMGLRNTAQVG